MLRELTIRNVAVIGELAVTFAPGLNVLTGETGAGKSILIDALQLVLGARAGEELLRAGAEEAVVEAAFDAGTVRKAKELLEAEGATVDAIYYCPHHPREGAPPYRSDCDCRKPRPGMLLRAAGDLNIDLSRSYMVGDGIVDMGAGRAAGVTTILVLTGYGRGHLEHRRERWTVEPDHVAENLGDAVEWILRREPENRG